MVRERIEVFRRAGAAGPAAFSVSLERNVGKGGYNRMEQARLSTKTLLIAIRDPNDNAAWKEFYKRYFPVIVNICRRFNLGVQDAEDTAQEILTVLARKARDFVLDPSKPGGFGGYIRKMTVNAVKDLRAKRAALRPGDEWILAASDSHAIKQIADGLRRERERELLEIAVERVRAELSEPDRAAFKVILESDLPRLEAARRLGLEVSKVYNMAHQFRKLLYEALRKVRREDRI